jgi:hypothetical protein
MLVERVELESYIEELEKAVNYHPLMRCHYKLGLITERLSYELPEADSGSST